MTKKQQQPVESPLYDVRHVAQVVGVTPATVYSMIDKGIIPVVRLGRTVRVHRDALESLIRPGTPRTAA